MTYSVDFIKIALQLITKNGIYMNSPKSQITGKLGFLSPAIMKNKSNTLKNAIFLGHILVYKFFGCFEFEFVIPCFEVP